LESLREHVEKLIVKTLANRLGKSMMFCIEPATDMNKHEAA
jgi:hypothetical protein